MNRPLLLATKLAFGAMVGIGTIGLWVTNIATDTRRYEDRSRAYDQFGYRRHDA